MPKSYPDFPHHTHIAKYFDDYVDHFGIRDRIRFGTGVEHAARRPDGVWEVTLDDGNTHRYDALLVANGHHWDARWPEPAFPGLGGLRGRADALARLQGRRPRPVPRQDRRRARDGQLGDGHRGRGELRRRAHLPGRAPRRVRPPQVPVRQADRPARRLDEDPVRGPPASSSRGCSRSTLGDMERYGLPKPDHRFGDAHPTISDDILSRMAHGDDHREAEHRVADPRRACASPTAPRSRPTSSSTARATRSRSRSSTRASSRRRTTTCRCSAAPSTPTSRTCSSSGCCSRSARSCRSRRRRGSGSATTSPAATRCPRRPTCAPTWRTSGAACSSATWPRSATRCRSTSTTGWRRSPRSARRGRSGRGCAATRCRCRRRADAPVAA